MLLYSFRLTKTSWNACSLAASIVRGIWLSLMAISLTPQQIVAWENPVQFANPERSLSTHEVAGARSTVRAQRAVAPHPKRANFQGEHKSQDARRVADWVVDSGDHRGLPFAIVDKADAKVFVFDAHGRLRGAAPALLGLARGDYAVGGIGDKELSVIRPEERTTPAGRFLASMGVNSKRKDVLWVDYKNAVSLHRVITDNSKEQRLERLATATPLDNRISYGCINVPANFFNHVVKATFSGTSCIVYVLPETRTISEIFKSYYDVDLRRGIGTTENVNDHPRPQQKDLRFGRHKAPALGPGS